MESNPGDESDKRDRPRSASVSRSPGRGRGRRGRSSGHRGRGGGRARAQNEEARPIQSTNEDSRQSTSETRRQHRGGRGRGGQWHGRATGSKKKQQVGQSAESAGSNGEVKPESIAHVSFQNKRSGHYRGRRGGGGGGRGQGANDQSDAARSANRGRQQGKTSVKHNGTNGPNTTSDQKGNGADVKSRTAPTNRRGKKPANGKQQQQQGNWEPYPLHWSYSDCLELYVNKDPLMIRGKLRVLPAKDGKAFVTCDRGNYAKDVFIATTLEQNRALDGDAVFVELYPPEEGETNKSGKKTNDNTMDEEVIDLIPVKTWQDDDIQRRLWNPAVVIPKPHPRSKQNTQEESQRSGRVVHVIMPKETAGAQASELTPTDQSHLHRAPTRTIVGRLDRMRRRQKGNVYFLTANNKSLPQFVCPKEFKIQESDNELAEILYKAEYVYGSWNESQPKPPCVNVQEMGKSCNVEDETLALLTEYDVNHGEFPAPVLQDVDAAVESGMVLQSSQEMGWRPTPDMYANRRDFREERIFTIDPTTAKDLDDALHIKQLPNGRVEIGVHIADVSHFVQPGTAVDEEALRRATTVYLVDRTVPMLPRPLCEIACSLNENVERLALSCVWRMNMDGTIENQGAKHGDEVWYGRSVIESCARLDYATAQNIIEGKVANGEALEYVDSALWPVSRRPSGKHSIDQVAADVRLMNRVAQARRHLRFQNGAIALNGIKLAFQLDGDGETPLLCAPYPIRDSNRLVEEFMLLANYFVAQRLITHAGGLALLRSHPPPLMDGIGMVVHVAKEGIGFEIDPSTSQSLQASLSRLGRECNDELVLQCVTEMLMTPMKPAEYMAAGSVDEQETWRHFALNIPYYTHFTSPIRRYADVIVHRLLQATLDDNEAIETFYMDESDVQSVSVHCNEKKMASKKASDRSDRVFLALYLKKRPLTSQLGVVLSVGEKAFTIYVPAIGASVKCFLDEHEEQLTFEPYSRGDERRIRVMRKSSTANSRWSVIDIKVFTKLAVSCHCRDKPPIDVKAILEGPWDESLG